ncbi:hypothetical protein KC723_01575 [Candidatus Kaiserbacteria bacterium]|nr:hypothetical protein [Candidatus Kaiserbacteria bacterium]
MFFVRSYKFAVATLFALLCLVFLGAEVVHAGFGITPPYVRNTSLTRNSVYEQQILLVRGDPDNALDAEITVDAPEIEDWLEIVEGSRIPMPEGVRKVPMTVRVTVPDDVDFGQYKGKIRIKTLPAGDNLKKGQVNISLGAQVDIDLIIIDKEIKDFRVRKISVADLNEGHKKAWLYFPGRIVFKMSVENIGNVDVAPSKVVFRIYDRTGTVLLEETKNTGHLKKIKPFATADIVAELPTRLPAGGYIARYQIYNDDEVKQEGELNMTILPYGTLPLAGYGFIGLSFMHKLSVLLPIFMFMIAVLYTIWFRQQRKKVRGEN